MRHPASGFYILFIIFNLSIYLNFLYLNNKHKLFKSHLEAKSI